MRMVAVELLVSLRVVSFLFGTLLCWLSAKNQLFFTCVLTSMVGGLVEVRELEPVCLKVCIVFGAWLVFGA